MCYKIFHCHLGKVSTLSSRGHVLGCIFPAFVALLLCPSTSHRLLDKEFVHQKFLPDFLQQLHFRSLLQTLTTHFRYGVPATEYWSAGDRNLFPEPGMYLSPLAIVHGGTFLESRLTSNSVSNSQLLNLSMVWLAESTRLALDRQK